MNPLTVERIECDQRIVARRWSRGTITNDHRDNIALAALFCFRSCHHAELKQIECEFRAGILTIRGRVSSYYMKQIAQESVRSLEGVDRIINRLDVGLRLKNAPDSRTNIAEESFANEHLRMSLPSSSNCDSFSSLSFTPISLIAFERVQK